MFSSFIQISLYALEVLDGLKFNEIEEWDSIGHMSLMSALEEAFDISLETDDIVDFSSYEKGKDILKKYNIDSLQFFESELYYLKNPKLPKNKVPRLLPKEIRRRKRHLRDTGGPTEEGGMLLRPQVPLTYGPLQSLLQSINSPLWALRGIHGELPGSLTGACPHCRQ